MPTLKLVSRLLNTVCALVIGWSPVIRRSWPFTVLKKRLRKLKQASNH